MVKSAINICWFKKCSWGCCNEFPTPILLNNQQHFSKTLSTCTYKVFVEFKCWLHSWSKLKESYSCWHVELPISLAAGTWFNECHPNELRKILRFNKSREPGQLDVLACIQCHIKDKRVFFLIQKTIERIHFLKIDLEKRRSQKLFLTED